VGAAEQQQQEVQGEQQQQEEQHLLQRRLSDSDAEWPSSAAAAEQQQQADGGGGGGAAPTAAELDVFSEMLYAVTHFSRLEPMACIPPASASASASASSSTRGCGAHILSSVEFDCRGQLFAAAGVQQHVLVHDYHAVLEQCSGSQQQQQAAASGIAPLLDIPMSSKLSCVSFSPTVQHYLLSSDYEGQVHLLDVTGVCSAQGVTCGGSLCGTHAYTPAVDMCLQACVRVL
jgi:hypothetical protein